MIISEKDLEHLNLPSPIITNCTYYLDNGDILNNEEFDTMIQRYRATHLKPPLVCAKEINNTNTGINTYYILTAGSQMFDPRITNKTNPRYRVRNRWKLRRIHKSFYDLYIQFLKTNHTAFLHQAERGL